MSICFAKVPIELTGDHKVKQYLDFEYSRLPRSSDQPIVTFKIHSELQESRKSIAKPNKDSTNLDKVWLSKDSIFIDNRSFNPIGDVGYAIELKKHPYLKMKSGLEVDVYCDEKVFPRNLREKGKIWFEKQQNWNYLSRSSILAKNLIYDVIEPITHMHMLHHNCAFMHASGVCDADNNAILFSGSGGVGKSNTSIALILDGGWKFISDDLCMIDNSGEVYCYPKYIQIYAYNTRAIPALYNRLITRRGLIDLIQWHRYEHFRGKDKVRRRVSPTDIFGKEILGNKAKISKVIHLTLASNNKFEIEPIKPKELAKTCRDVINKEFESFFKHLNTINEMDSSYPTVKEILNASEDLYFKAFKQADCYLFSLPKAAKVNKILKFLKNNVL
jgi:hypothetical protein